MKQNKTNTENVIISTQQMSHKCSRNLSAVFSAFLWIIWMKHIIFDCVSRKDFSSSDIFRLLFLPHAFICSKCKENLYVSLFILLSIDLSSLRQEYYCFLTAWCILGTVWSWNSIIVIKHDDTRVFGRALTEIAFLGVVKDFICRIDNRL